MLSIGKHPNHHADPVQHALRRYFHAMPKWQRNQLLKESGAIVNQLYSDLKKTSNATPSSPVSNSRAARDCCDAGALEIFLSAVAKEIDVSDKNIDPAYGMRMLHETLHAIVKMHGGDTDKSEIPFSIADYDFLAQGGLFKSIDSVRKDFRRHLRNSTPGLNPEAARWLATQLLAGYEPVLDRTDVPDDCVYGSLIFSDIQAGIDTAVAINIDPSTLTWEVLAGLADTIDIAARSNPDFDPLFYQPQIEAALRYANARHHIDIHRDGITGEVISRAVAERDRARIAWRDRALEPIRKAIELLQRPAPDRIDIAERRLIALGVDPYEMGRDTRTRQTGLGLCSGDRQLRQFYLDDCEFRLNNALQKAGGQLSDLADLDAEYGKELDAYFSELTQATATLIAMSANQLDADDYLFWSNNPVQLLQAIVTVTELSGAVPGSFGPQALPRDKATEIQGEKTLLFASGDADSMRFYQVSLTDAQISLEHAKLGIVKRITLASGDINDYIDGRRELFFEPDALEEIPELAHTVIYGTRPLGAIELPPHAARSTQAAAVAFSAFIREEQYEQGYKTTGLQQFRRTMGNFAKSLLPFHDCVVSVNAGREGEAVADCSLEALSVLPLSRLILFSQTLRKPLTRAFIRGIGKSGVRGLSQKTLSGAATEMQSTLQAAGKDLASGLGKDFISAIFVRVSPHTGGMFGAAMNLNRPAMRVAALPPSFSPSTIADMPGYTGVRFTIASSATVDRIRNSRLETRDIFTFNLNGRTYQVDMNAFAPRLRLHTDILADGQNAPICRDERGAQKKETDFKNRCLTAESTEPESEGIRFEQVYQGNDRRRDNYVQQEPVEGRSCQLPRREQTIVFPQNQGDFQGLNVIIIDGILYQGGNEKARKGGPARSASAAQYQYKRLAELARVGQGLPQVAPLPAAISAHLIDQGPERRPMIEYVLESALRQPDAATNEITRISTRIRRDFFSRRSSPGNPAMGLIEVEENTYYEFSLPSIRREASTEVWLTRVGDQAIIDAFIQQSTVADRMLSERFSVNIAPGHAATIIDIFRKCNINDILGSALQHEKDMRQLLRGNDAEIDGALLNYIGEEISGTAEPIPAPAAVLNELEIALTTMMKSPDRIAEFRRTLRERYQDRRRNVVFDEVYIPPPAAQGPDARHISGAAHALEEEWEETRAFFNETYPELQLGAVSSVQEINAAFARVFDSRNVAILVFETSDGQVYHLDSVSGTRPIPTRSAPAGNARYVLVRGVPDAGAPTSLPYLTNLLSNFEAQSREGDTERVLFSWILARFPHPDAITRVKLISRLEICHSCVTCCISFAEHYKNATMEFSSFPRASGAAAPASTTVATGNDGDLK